MKKQESEVSNATPPTSEVEKLLGQATPRPFRCGGPNIFGDMRLYSVTGKLIATFENEDDAQLIVLAVNALPAFLKLREEAESAIEQHNQVYTVTPKRVAKLKSALASVDSALKEKDLV